MSTPNTPAPGTPAWLRAMSDCNARCDRDEDAQGLRAAAERIETTDSRIEELEVWGSRSLARNAELSDEVQRLRAENEALKADKERLDWLERNRLSRCYFEGSLRFYSEHLRMDGTRGGLRAAIDAARKEGA